MNRPRHPGSLAGLAIVILVTTFTLISCEDFFGAEDLKEKIKEDVEIANAQKVTISLPIENANMGIPNSSTLEPKVGVPFTVSTTVGDDYDFLGWSAENGEVVFTNPEATTTSVVITKAGTGALIINRSFEQKPTVVITLQAEKDSMGVPTPYAAQTFKLNTPYAISTTVDSKYVFLAWTHNGEEGDIIFDDPESISTSMTATAIKPDLRIIPTFERRPEPVSWDPYPNDKGIITDKTILIYFNKPIDQESVVLGSDESVQVISRYSKPNPDGTMPEFEHIEQLLNVTVNGSQIIISLEPDQRFGFFNEVKITLTPEILDLNGNGMADEYSSIFQTGSGVDDEAPVIQSYLIENPDAGIGETMKALGAAKRTVARIRQELGLAKNNKTDRIRVQEYLDQNPDAKIEQIQQDLTISKSTIYRIQKEIKDGTIQQDPKNSENV